MNEISANFHGKPPFLRLFSLIIKYTYVFVVKHHNWTNPNTLPVRVCGKFVVYIHFRLLAAMFDIPPTLIYNRIRTSAVMLLDLKNIRIAVGILLLSCIAELHVISYALPILGCHL